MRSESDFVIQVERGNAMTVFDAVDHDDRVYIWTTEGHECCDVHLDLIQVELLRNHLTKLLERYT